MKTEEFGLNFEKAGESDILTLTEIMTRAFDDDSQRHLGKPKGGPPGYDNGDFFRTWLLPYEQSHGYKIILDEKVVGGIIVWILPSNENRVGTIFVDPEFQRRGIGSRIMQFIFKKYPNSSSWTLGTPSFALSNHKFYEKNGFVKIGEERDEGLPDEVSFIYCKKMNKNS